MTKSKMFVMLSATICTTALMADGGEENLLVPQEVQLSHPDEVAVNEPSPTAQIIAPEVVPT
ncbi:MAG: hypothetical protein ACHQT8_05110, partial [Chlamydiales bacterium]